MTWSRHFSTAALASLCVAGSVCLATAEESAPLEPYQMVRSLQLVQDRIASGDHAALPMQRKLLEMIDKRFQGTDSDDFADRRNFQALLVYAMSGGNPKTIDRLLGRLHLDETERALATGILAYLNGDVNLARSALEPVEPLTLAPDLGAFFALVKGSIIAPDEPAKALKMFDKARLLGPGTLVEEAALRRSLPLDARTLDAAHFILVSSQYVRRFLISPYAGQFADAFVAGVIALHKTIDLREIENIASRMDPERRKVIYLRLARRAALEGLSDLTEYASAKADSVEVEGVDPGSDPRALLYSSLATITSDTVDQVLPKLKAIDRTRLSKNDLELLEAAEAIAAEVTADPEAPMQAAGQNAPADKMDREVAARSATTPVEDDLPEAEPIDSAQAAAHSQPAETDPAVHAETTPSEPQNNLEQPVDLPATEDLSAPHKQPGHDTIPAEATVGDADDLTSTILADTRKKLDEIDKLLKDTAQ